MAPPLTFEKLFREENDLLSEVDPSSTKQTLSGLEVETPGPAGEPWIRSTPVDRVGLAFSGGGIRSATFNLGVLKALHELGLLKDVDYLSTVSGGGYVGAWWSAWRARVGRVFPEAQTSSQTGTSVTQAEMNREPDEVRHLREFSNFLSPRIGFFQSEMWNAVIAVLSALLPAMAVASAVMALAFLVWLGVSSLILFDALNMPISSPHWLQVVAGWVHRSLPELHWLKGWLTPVLLSLFMIALHICFERSWRALGKAEQPSSKKEDRLVHRWLLFLVSAAIFLGWFLFRFLGCFVAIPPAGPHPWEWAAGIMSPQDAAFSFSPPFSPYLFAAPILWAAIAVFLLVPRLLIMRRKREQAGTLVSTIDRALSRLLGTALVLTALAALWLAGCWMNHTEWGANVPAGGALVSGGTFALLRNWMGRLGSGKKGGVMDMVKPLIPQILAYVAIAFWAICVAALLARLIKGDWSPFVLFAFALGIVLFAVFGFDAAQVSMHSFYRNRLSRAYLGASNIDAITQLRVYADRNRQTDLRWHDDIEMCALSPTADEVAKDEKRSAADRVYAKIDTIGASRVRPLHLVCCAANDLGGDHLENLSRGSRSAVLSKFGYAIGDYWKAWKDEKNEKGENHKTLGLGSAITASAAAFNSNMGSLSMTLGAGVTFLCTALNLRLGLWLPHPLSTKYGVSRFTPGWLFFKEMFGLTNSGLRPELPKSDTTADASDSTLDKSGAPPNQPGTASTGTKPNQDRPVAEDVHLSDGGHFENLALYELVRRHCRYIIVSDCGADPEVTFDDFGNAVRRIREDFGVEIEIDLSPLKPDAARLSKQHVAVGTISYDPRGDRKDSAILLYFKPTLTGDEPCDITQYRTRNESFPHESTGDQFYDEAQWESYRRLGEHATRSALRFVEQERQADALSPEAVFNGARLEWYQSPERRDETILDLTGRLTQLEEQLRQDGPESFVREMYPELHTLNKETATAAAAPAKPAEMCATLHFLIQMMQLMEDIWLVSSLETHWNHPNNLGWMNTFQRWAYTPSFRLWWPILKPMFGRKFRRFMEERLDLADEDYPPTMPKVKKHGKKLPEGVAQIYWNRMKAEEPARGVGKTIYSYDLDLTLQTQSGDDVHYLIQAGLAFLDLKRNEDLKRDEAHWTAEEIFVPPSLWGAGIGSQFLDKLLDTLRREGITRFEVKIEPVTRTDAASRQQRNDLLAFYQRAHFGLEGGLLVLDLT